VRGHGLKSESGWPPGKLRLTLMVGFGGLSALMVLAGLDALRLARELQTQEDGIRRAFLAHTQPLLVLSSSIYIYNDRIQEYLMSQDPQADRLTAEKFSRLTAEISSTLNSYPKDRQPEEVALLKKLQQLFTDQQGMLNPVLSWSQVWPPWPQDQKAAIWLPPSAPWRKSAPRWSHKSSHPGTPPSDLP
jgi:hypothetical protein